MKIKPLGDRVLVKPLEQKEVKKGGIIIPDTAKEKPMEGEVIAAGKGKVGDDGKLIPMNVKAGDKVLYGKYSGTEIKIDDVEHLIMGQEDILPARPAVVYRAGDDLLPRPRFTGNEDGRRRWGHPLDGLKYLDHRAAVADNAITINIV